MITKPIIPVVVMVPLLLIVLVIYSIGAIRRSVKIRYNISFAYKFRYKVNRFLKNKQKIGTIGFPLTTTNLENKKLFTSQSSPDVINQ